MFSVELEHQLPPELPLTVERVSDQLGVQLGKSVDFVDEKTGVPPDLLFGGWAGAIVVQGGFFRFWVGGTGCARGGLVCGEGVLGGSCGVTNGIFGAVRVNVVVLSWWFVFDREN